jgi:hypothetical protein
MCVPYINLIQGLIVIRELAPEGLKQAIQQAGK